MFLLWRSLSWNWLTGTNASECQSGWARLTRFKGRRVIFLVTQPGVPLGDVTLAEALLSGVSVYHVGGDPWKQEFPAGYAAAGSNSLSSTSSDEAVSMVDGNSDAPLFVRVRYRETEDRTFGGAIREALRDGYGYYDLTVNMPADVRRLEMAVNISEPTGGTYSIYAQPYVAQGRSPELSLVGAKR
jgi:hypothetical protein